VASTGTAELARLSAALRATGRNDLRKELLRGLRNGAKPMVPAAREAALAALPKRGGLAADVAGAKWAVRTRLSGNPSVRLTGGWASHDMAALDSGLLRHPVFGHRRRWVSQPIPPHWFTDAMNQLAPEFRDELLKVIDDMARRMAASV
jgi:hypothetical protein